MSTKYIFVTGGVASSLGKGITAASLGRLLKARGLKVAIQKCDPYINIDPGTMNPYQHGEVFVTEDGAETDLDLGHYERFIDENLTKHSSITSGQIYQSVINKERMGQYLGATVQMVPHVTNEIKSRIMELGNTGVDVAIIEIGGTVGDMEGQCFLEAIRQIRHEVPHGDVLYIHVTLVPYLNSGELKTKPTQHSTKELLSVGIQPHIIVCRCDREIPSELKSKISQFCNVSADCVISNLDAESLYAVPLMLEREGLARLVCRELSLDTPEPDLTEWTAMVQRHLTPKREITIALAGKYTGLHDAYLSVVEALTHGGIHHNVKVNVKWIASDDMTQDNAEELLKDVDGLLIPGGFGTRGIEGKISAIRYARENNLPFFGICLGMQMAVVEFARNILGLQEANTTEADKKTKYPVVDYMPEQLTSDKRGGTMRLGGYRCSIAQNSRAMDAYQKEIITERHRHRYELNNDFAKQMVESGLQITGVNPERGLAEIVEIAEHPWFVGVQFHPEFKSRPNRPHPLFRDFIGAAVEHQKSRESSDQ